MAVHAEREAEERRDGEHDDPVDGRWDADRRVVQDGQRHRDRERAVVDADLHRGGESLAVLHVEQSRDAVPQAQAGQAEHEGDQPDAPEVLGDVLALGDGAVSPITSGIKYFKHEFLALCDQNSLKNQTGTVLAGASA